MALQIQAGSAKSWKYCVRRAWFEYNPPAAFDLPVDRFEQLISERGMVHERAVLSGFQDAVEAHSAEHTLELMRQRTRVIYQPVLIDPEAGIVGKPDFLILHSSGEYQVADAKLAGSLKDHPEIKIQLALYRRMLNSKLPALAFLGSGETAEIGDEASKDLDRFLHSMEDLLTQETAPPAYFSESKCKACPYDDLCRPGFIKNGELTLVYGVDSRSVAGLNAQGIAKITDLAQTEPEQLKDVPYIKGVDKLTRICLQARSYLTGEIFKLKPMELPSGTWIHFDVENNPLAPGGPIYIWGLLPPPYTKAAFEYLWGEEHQDREIWLLFLEKLEEYRARFPELRLAHFSNFEVDQIKKHAERYAMQEHATVRWLLSEDGPLVDLLEIVKDCLVLPVLGYGLKGICKDKRLVGFNWELEESGSQWSVVRYLDYLEEQDRSRKEAIKNEILSYNRDDVRATHALEQWLRSR